MKTQAPRLLIYIPSYNRAKNVLRHLEYFEEFKARTPGSSLRVVVNDNCSTQVAEYREVRRRCEKLGFIYRRNASNLGPNPNILNGFTYLEDADYLWICSDDELLKTGALDRIFEVLESNSDLDILSFSQVARSAVTKEKIDQSRLLDELNIAGLGLISLVVYRSGFVRPHVRAGFDGLISCFPHLIVLFETVRREGWATVLFLSAEDVFLPDGKCPPADSNAYLKAHYGFMLLAQYLEPRLRRSLCLLWWRSYSVEATANAALEPAHSAICFRMLERDLPLFKIRRGIARLRVPYWHFKRWQTARLRPYFLKFRERHPELRNTLETLKQAYWRLFG